MKFNKKRKIYELTDLDVKKLNSFDCVNKFPSALKTPKINSKVLSEKRIDTGGNCAMAKDNIKSGEILCYGNSSKINKPIKYSWQIDKDVHLIGPGLFDHKCENPNCIIDSKNNLIASRDIKKGEFLTFNYLTTEYDMSQSFVCTCGDEKCFGEIRGFKYLKREEKDRVFEIGASNYIKKFKYSLKKDYKYKKYTDFCIETCNEVKEIYQKFNFKNKSYKKKNRDIVTDLDRKIEKYVRNKIRSEFKDHKISGEEYGDSKEVSDYAWIIDPIDGTENFINKLNFFAFSVALKYKGKIISGAVYDFNNDIIYNAAKDIGSYRNDYLIDKNILEDKSSSIISIVMPGHYSNKIKLKNIDVLKELYISLGSIRVIVCHSLEIINVALGRFDGVVCIKTRGFSSAAAILFLKELGGEVHEIKFNIKNEKTIEGVLACNNEVFDEISKAIKKAGGKVFLKNPLHFKKFSI